MGAEFVGKILEMDGGKGWLYNDVDVMSLTEYLKIVKTADFML